MRTTLSLLAALALVSAACGGQVEEATSTTAVTTTTTTVATTTTSRPPTTTTTQASTTTTEAGPVSPIDGLPVEDEQLLERRVLAVKIDNHPNARPQSGLEKADAVYELLVEGGLTRFISIWHDSDADYVGPMRSGRPTDPTLLKPLGATFAISGAQPWVIDIIRSSGVPLLGEIRPATFRISSRRAPHNLYVDTTKLRDAADRNGYSNDPPEALWRFGPMPDGAEDATVITLDFSGKVVAGWTWDGEDYVRTTNGVDHEVLTRDGERGPVTADTLVVLFADRYTSYPPKGAGGSAVPAMDTVGSGRALVFHGGKVTEGTWSRADKADPFVLEHADGSALLVPPGKPWISVFPNDRSVTW